MSDRFNRKYSNTGRKQGFLPVFEFNLSLYRHKMRQERDPCPTTYLSAYVVAEEQHLRLVSYKNSISYLFPYTAELKFICTYK